MNNFSNYAYQGTFINDPNNPISGTHFATKKLWDHIYFVNGPPLGIYSIIVKASNNFV